MIKWQADEGVINLTEKAIVNSDNISGLIQRTLNFIDSRLIDHGLRVALLVAGMLDVQGRYEGKQRQDIGFLAMLHDIGAYKTEEIDEMIRFESDNIWGHSIYGYLFLKYLSPLSELAPAVLLHHANIEDIPPDGLAYADIAQMIHLADRVDMLLQNTRLDRSMLASYLERSRGKRFSDAVVDDFWAAQQQYGLLEKLTGPISFGDVIEDVQMSDEECKQYLEMLVYAIDFRSQHTVTHTITTTQISRELARIMGLDDVGLQQVYYGAMLHDLGKIGIPVEILEFPGKLSTQAMDIMRTHVDLTAKILGGTVDDATTLIALRHHEKLDGSGYPLGLAALDLTPAQRIVACADIVSALSGTRSYKRAYPKEQTLDIIGEQADQGKLDAKVVQTLAQSFDQIMTEVDRRCQPVLTIYNGIHHEFEQMITQYAPACRLS